MKTKFFRESGFTETGKKRLKVLAELKPEARPVFIAWFKQLKQKPRFDKSEIRELATATGESAEVVEDVVLATNSILQSLGDLGDSPDDFVSDLRASNTLDDKQCDNIQRYVEDLSCVVQLYYSWSRIRATEFYGAPSLSAASMSVAIKPVYVRNFRYGEDDLTTFDLKPISYTCVALVELEKDDAKEHFAFQMNSDNFDRFLSDLIILQGRMKQMGEKIKTLNQDSGGGR